jgi:hypothetical protein
LPTGAVSSEEQWEGVLVRVENVTVTDDNLGYGEWSVSDGSGDVVVDDKGSYSYSPTTGEALAAIVGPLDFGYGAFKIQPRDDGDITAMSVPGGAVINEFLADPAGDLSGDANGDGTRDGSEDEFVEIANTGDTNLDVSGWTLSDAVAVRHTFPAGTIIPAGCAIVVFGGGTPTGAFGYVQVQTASGGYLGLNNGGDTITLNDGTSDAVDEYYDLTELKTINSLTICSSGNAFPSAASINLPVDDLTDWEQYEGMLVHLGQELTVSENFGLGRYGEVVLSNGRLWNPTHLTTPGTLANEQQALNDRNRIILDDASTYQNPDPILYPAPELTAENTLRGGDTVQDLLGVLTYHYRH